MVIILRTDEKINGWRPAHHFRAFGLGNAWSDTRAYGGTLEQATGLPLYTGHADGPPAMTSYAYGDPVGGLNAGAALLLALHRQRETGRGMHLNLSQVEAMLHDGGPCAD